MGDTTRYARLFIYLSSHGGDKIYVRDALYSLIRLWLSRELTAKEKKELVEKAVERVLNELRREVKGRGTADED